jgi:hypothetical protein
MVKNLDPKPVVEKSIWDELESNPHRLVALIQNAQMAVQAIAPDEDLQVPTPEIVGPPTIQTIFHPKHGPILSPEELDVCVEFFTEVTQSISTMAPWIDKGANMAVTMLNSPSVPANISKPENLREAIVAMWRQLITDGNGATPRHATTDGRIGTIVKTLWDIRNFYANPKFSKGM